MRLEAAAGLTLAAALAFGAPAAAELSQPVLLGDLGHAPTAAQPIYIVNGGVQFVPFAGATYFDAWDGARGQELWKSDGTAAGTAVVRDVCPGSCNGRIGVELVESAGALFFQADDGAHGQELWKSDGTAAGTVLVKDVRPGLRSSWPSFLTPAPGGVYFVADDGVHGLEIWFSDGSAAGTHLVADVLPGDPEDDYEGPTHLVVLGGGLLFAASDGVHGRELWRTDGTLAGTTLVKDLVTGAPSSMFVYQAWPFAWNTPVVAGGQAFFAAASDASSARVVPWVSDGTTSGTIALVTPAPLDDWSTRSFLPFGDDVLFSGGPFGARTLWRSDGTPAGTTPLGTAANGGEELNPFSLTRVGGLVYFRGLQPATGTEPWVTDGTVAGTHLVTDIVPGSAGSLSWSLFGFAAGGGRVFFPADDGTHGLELWSSDGTAAGTAMVSDLAPGSIGAFLFDSPTYPSAVGQQLFFRAWDGEQWTVRALDLQNGAVQQLHANTDPAGSISFCFLQSCGGGVPRNGGFAFIAFDAVHGGEPWVTDGTPAGTGLVADLRTGTATSMWGLPALSLAVLPETLLMSASSADERAQLWGFDGTSTVQLTDETVDPGVTEIAAWNGNGFFNVGWAGGGLWRSDGTAPGTLELVADLVADRFTPAESSLFFAGGGQPWVSDGTAAQTHAIAPSTFFQLHQMTAAEDEEGADRLYFSARSAGDGNELWVSDGTEAGTQRVVDLRGGGDDAIPFDAGNWPYDAAALVGLGSRAVFAADAGNGAGEELWVSDGSPGNATLLEVRPGAAGSEPRAFTAVEDRVYFVADDGVHGREPWVTDGTIAGTHLVADVRPGAESSTPSDLEGWNGGLVFAADDGVHGKELWQTASAAAGAELVVELRPGVAPSSPQGLTANGDALLFFADDGTTGLEPWVVYQRRPLLVDAFESGDLQSWSARAPAP